MLENLFPLINVTFKLEKNANPNAMTLSGAADPGRHLLTQYFRIYFIKCGPKIVFKNFV